MDFIWSKMPLKERSFQKDLIKELEELFPGIVILKNNPNYRQGFPDLLLLYEDKWAVLEVKRAADSPAQPNQIYYVETLGQMSYASFIYPENWEQVIHEIQQAFRS